MLNTLSGMTILVIMIVITRADILESVPIGTPEKDALAYFEQITDNSIFYYTREDDRRGTVSHQLRTGEHGFYLVRLDRVRPRWWQPSLGSSLRIIVVISDAGYVSHIDFHSAMSGWP